MVSLRNISSQDFKLLFYWRNDPSVIETSASGKAVEWEEHINWITSKLASNNVDFFILTTRIEDVGFIRLDKTEEGFVINYSIAASFRNKGFGKKIIELTIERKGEATYIAYVKPNNTASLRIFERLGFVEHYNHADKTLKKLILHNT
jgi:UDP-2,4-diacetamido-2,4,6-trideoxy-beta-L-altropyranose hydrolase